MIEQQPLPAAELALQARADKAEAECEQWRRLVTFLRERLAKSQKHNREAATYCRASLSGVWHLGQQAAAAELAEVRADRDRNSKCYRDLADVTDTLRARCVHVEQERDEVHAALGRAVAILTAMQHGEPGFDGVSCCDWCLATAPGHHDWCRLKPILDDPTGQVAAERWKKLEVVVKLASNVVVADGSGVVGALGRAMAALAQGLAALDKGKGGQG